MSKYKLISVAAIFVLCAASAMATNFRAADQVYVPVVGHLTIGSGVTFVTDVFITNLSSTESVTVSVIYCPQGQTCTSQPFPNLITLLPNAHKELVDWCNLRTDLGGLGLTSAYGQAVFNGCKTGTDCGPLTQDANGFSPNFRNISVETRIYALPAGKTVADKPPTTGQLFSGYPWYNFVSQDQAANGLDKVFVTGIRQTGLPGEVGTYRSNIGFANASQYSSTTIVVKLFQSDGTQVGSEYAISLGPLASLQPGISGIPAFAGASGTGLWATVEQRGTAPTADAAANGCPTGCPAFFAYGSVLDNISGDATTLEPQYLKALTDVQIGCIYPAPGQAACKGTSIMRRAVKK
jgi:hypothetical protein